MATPQRTLTRDDLAREAAVMPAADAAAMLDREDWSDAGTAEFKGIPGPVALARIGPATPSS